jgi:hypothetical protein
LTLYLWGVIPGVWKDHALFFRDMQYVHQRQSYFDTSSGRHLHGQDTSISRRNDSPATSYTSIT